MKREGIVVNQYSDNIYEIVLLQHNACKHCGACLASKRKTLRAYGEPGLSKGAVVEIELSDRNIFIIGWFVYFLPVVFMLIFGFAGYYISGIFIVNTQTRFWISIVSGLIFFLSAFFFGIWYIKQDKGRFMPKISRVSGGIG